MRENRTRHLMGAAAGGLVATTGVPAPGRARSLPGFRHDHATVNGVRLHYVAGGQGAPIVLLPGWPRTWWEFHKIMPTLAATRRVIAVDLRGMGDSAKPATGYDKKTMAADIAALLGVLGHDQVDVVGSDIGAMVAFSLAANHPALVRTVTLLDVAHPEEGMFRSRCCRRPAPPSTCGGSPSTRSGPAGAAARRPGPRAGRLPVRPDAREQDAVTDRDRTIYADAYQSRTPSVPATAGTRRSRRTSPTTARTRRSRPR